MQPTTPADAPPLRPSASVIVPFAGSEAGLVRVLDELRALRLGPHDEVIVADNRTGASTDRVQDGIRLIAAAGVRSPGFARNRAAAAARGEWLIFIDADTEPGPSLIDAYLSTPPAPQTAILAGRIVDRAERPTAAARHSAERRQMSDQVTLSRTREPYAQTANCAVRRSALIAVGGFDECARAGEDADLCFRLARSGWRLEERRAAWVTHRSRESLVALLVQLARHGSGAAWLNRRYPGSFPAPRPGAFTRRLLRHVYEALRAALRGRSRGAASALIDLAGACAFELGRLLPNHARRD
ncbi:MAG: glycosyltransferase [Solirubrobacteraceae bacterium]